MGTSLNCVNWYFRPAPPYPCGTSARGDPARHGPRAYLA